MSRVNCSCINNILDLLSHLNVAILIFYCRVYMDFLPSDIQCFVLIDVLKFLYYVKFNIVTF